MARIPQITRIQKWQLGAKIVLIPEYVQSSHQLKFPFRMKLFEIAPKESEAETVVHKILRKRVKTNKKEKTKVMNKDRRVRKTHILNKNSNNYLKIIISKYRRKSLNTPPIRAIITKIVKRPQFSKKMKDKEAEKLK